MERKAQTRDAGTAKPQGSPPQPVRTPLVRLPLNERGRDFVVGDIHGCFEMVLRSMEAARFDPSRDRIIAVGDLVNRGPHSHRALRFLSYDWVSSVRGNHEDLILRLHAEETDPAAAAFLASQHRMGWWFAAPDALREAMAEAFANLPIAIEVETASGTLGVVHADVPMGMAWPEFLASLEAFDQQATRTALWGRDRIRGGRCEGVDGIARVVVGHSDLPEGVTRFGNVYGVDTGAVYASSGPGHLSFLEAETLDDMIPGPDGIPGPGHGPTP